MSFTSEIKQEVAYNELKPCCTRAQLSALILLTSSLSISNRQLNLVVRSENPTTLKRVVFLLKKHYGVKTELTVIQKTNLRKNNIYTGNVISDGKAILEDLGLYSIKGLLSRPSLSIVSKDCCCRAFLAGAFLAYGSCNSPNKSAYHLEIALSELDVAEFIVKLIARFNIEAKIAKRRNSYVVYIKRAESIADFLRMIGANESLMNFENSRISRDFKNSIVRLGNCDIANEVKSLSAAKEQLEQINKIIAAERYDELDSKLKEIADLRLSFPEHSLIELCGEYERIHNASISKSGLKHRLNKLAAIAAEL